jgi:hypothetical protein
MTVVAEAFSDSSALAVADIISNKQNNFRANLF